MSIIFGSILEKELTLEKWRVKYEGEYSIMWESERGHYNIMLPKEMRVTKKIANVIRSKIRAAARIKGP